MQQIKKRKELGRQLKEVSVSRSLYSIEKASGLAGGQIKDVFDGKNVRLETFLRVIKALELDIRFDLPRSRSDNIE